MKNYISQICKIIDLLEIKNNKDEALQKLQELKSEMIFEQAKLNMSKSEKNLEKAIQDVLKEAPKEKPKFKKLFRDKDNICFCTGYVGGIIKSEIKGLEIQEEPVFNMTGIISQNRPEYQEVKLDLDIEEIERIAETNKHLKKEEQKGIAFNSGNIMICVNPKYIKQMLAIYGKDCKIYASTKDPHNVIILESEMGTGIICPIHLN